MHDSFLASWRAAAYLFLSLLLSPGERVCLALLRLYEVHQLTEQVQQHLHLIRGEVNISNLIDVHEDQRITFSRFILLKKKKVKATNL
jgi:hypothetical protein